MSAETVRIPESTLSTFQQTIFERLGVASETARLAVRTLVEGSLLGKDTHGVEALDLYTTHLRGGGLAMSADCVLIKGHAGLGLWDMQHGIGLASTRKIMAYAIERAREQGVYLASCRNTNHIGACGVYTKMAADQGMIGMISPQSRATFAPPGATEKRVGTTVIALAAPVAGGGFFSYDGSLSMINYAQIKAHLRAGTQLPEGVAMDADGNPTTDPKAVWHGQAMPIGGHKGFGLAMSFEVLHSVLSDGLLSDEIPSIVSNPEKSSDNGLMAMVIDPGVIMPRAEFATRMKRYVEHVESSPARDPSEPPRYPGRHAAECWRDRRENGIPVSLAALKRFDEIARSLGIECICRT